MSSQWPVVVSLPFERSRSLPAIAGAPGLRRAALERLDVAEPERFQARQVQPSDRPGDVSKRVGGRVVLAVLRSVGKGAGPDRIQHDDARAGHRAILGRAWKRLSD
jgi:hypothetical protein